MTRPSTTPSERIQQLLAELATLTPIERGSLSEEYRTVPGPAGTGTITLGPYFKLQCWENGANRSVRVPQAQVEALRQDLARGVRFDALTQELASLAQAEGRQRRTTPTTTPTPAAQTAAAESKKNSTPRAKTPLSKKPKPA